MDGWRSAAGFLEQSLDADWRESLSRLTAGGIVLAVVPSSKESQPDVLLLVESEKQSTLTKFVEAVHSEVAKRKTKLTESHSYRGMTFYRTGDAFYAQVGRTLAASNSRQMLIQYLDRVVSPEPIQDRRIPIPVLSDAGIDERPLSRARGYLSIEWLRQIRELQEGLKLPSAEPIGQLLFGGYLDLLRRAQIVGFELAIDDWGAEISCRIDAGSDNRPEEWSGFFADGRTTQAIPLLKPIGTIYSASWFRDYHELWMSRQDWLSAERIQEFESENERQKRSGAPFGILELASQLGTHYRIVVSQSETGPVAPGQAETDWPRAAFTVDLRDPPAFQLKFLTPLLSLLKVTVAGIGGVVESSTENTVEISTLRLKDPPASPLPPGLTEAFNPTVTVSGNHFLIGTSRGFVLELLDEINVDRRPDEHGSPTNHSTDEQIFSFVTLRKLVARFRRELERDIAQKNQAPPDEARREVDLMLQFLEQLDTLTSRGTLSSDGFEYQIQFGSRPTGR